MSMTIEEQVLGPGGPSTITVSDEPDGTVTIEGGPEGSVTVGGELSGTIVVEMPAPAISVVEVDIGPAGPPGGPGPPGPPGAANAVYTAEWSWSNQTVVPPNSGQFRTDTGDHTGTVVRIDKDTNGGTDVSAFLLAVKAGDDLRLQQKSDASNWLRWDLTAQAIDHGSYVSFPITIVDGSGTSINNNTTCDLSFLTEGATSSQWYTGPGAPPATLGRPGDMYLEDDGDVWASEEAAGWTPSATNIRGPQGEVGATGSQGPDGQRGSVWRTGSGAPSPVGGEIAGDLYLDTSTGDVYVFS